MKLAEKEISAQLNSPAMCPREQSPLFLEEFPRHPCLFPPQPSHAACYILGILLGSRYSSASSVEITAPAQTSDLPRAQWGGAGPGFWPAAGPPSSLPLQVTSTRTLGPCCLFCLVQSRSLVLDVPPEFGSYLTDSTPSILLCLGRHQGGGP